VIELPSPTPGLACPYARARHCGSPEPHPRDPSQCPSEALGMCCTYHKTKVSTLTSSLNAPMAAISWRSRAWLLAMRSSDAVSCSTLSIACADTAHTRRYEVNLIQTKYK
jgi:hypothetical protein